MIRLIAKHEIRSLLAAPSTWLMLGALQFILAWFFLVRLDAYLQLQSQLSLYANAPGATQLVLSPLFGTIALVMMMLIPAFTMRLLAEERRNQTLQLFLAAPVSAVEIVLGKFFGLLLFLWLAVIGCTAVVSVLALGTPMDFGLLFANMLGLLLLTASYAALGLYVSALTAQPVLASIGTLAALLALWLLDGSSSDGNHLLHTLTPTGHFQNLNGGLLDSTDLVYYLLFCIFFISLTIRRLNNNRFYG